MEIWGCRLNFRNHHIYGDISIDIYSLDKGVDDFFWSFKGCRFICCNRNIYDFDIFLYKQKCKEQFRPRKNFYLLDFCVKFDQLHFNENQLNRYVCNSDIDAYIDSFFKEVKG